MGEIVLSGLIIFYFLFALYSVLEKEWRAFKRSGMVLGGLILFLVAWIWAIPPQKQVAGYALFAVFVGLGLVMLLSPRPRAQLQIQHSPHKIDERDVVFARIVLADLECPFVEL